MIKRRLALGHPRAAIGGGLAVTLMMALPAMAIEVDFGDPDITARWDNTIRGNLGVRMEKQDPRVMASSNYDESDGKFKKGSLVAQRLDILSEFDLDYKKNFGFRVSGAAWYDHAYHNTSVNATAPGGYDSSYDNNHYSDQVSRYVRGPSGELLDAFGWWNFRIADKPADLRVGRLTNYWGEAYLLGNDAISYSQSPVDGVKAVNSPGIELKEVFLPLGQVYLKYQPTPDIALSGQYFFQWKPSRYPAGGTYFGPADFFFEGPDRLPLAPGFDLQRTNSLEGRRFHNWGVNAKINLESIESNLGLYYRQFDDYNPWFSPSTTGYVSTPGGVVPTQFRLVYPKNASLVGVSLARAVGPVSVGAEVSYRMHSALNAGGLDPITGEGPKGDTWHGLINGTYLMPKTALWDTGSLVVEGAYSHLDHVTSNASLYKGVGSPTCTNPDGGAGDKTDGCSTRDYAALAVLFTPQYLQVAPSLDLDLPMSLNYGLYGNGAASGSGNEGTYTWSVGAKLTYAQRHELQILYSDAYSHAKFKNGALVEADGAQATTSDRGWLVITYKYGF